MMWNKKKLFVIGIITLLLATVSAVIIKQGLFINKSKNLALMRGVKASCDSMETEDLSADKAIDGDDETLSSRWSSENNWDDASHYIELEFPEEISVSFVVLKWERTNVISYQLEASLDGKNWSVLEEFDHAPKLKRQEIVLSESATLKFIRLSTNAVSQNEEDYSNLYQNVSLYEFEVYADKPAAYYVDEPVIEVREDGSRRLQMPEAPDGYKLTFLGADYEQIIGADGEIYENIQDKDVVVGFLIESMDEKEDTQEVSFTIHVPAANNIVEMANDVSLEDYEESQVNEELVGKESVGEKLGNERPQIIPAISEWKGERGTFEPDKHSRMIVEDESLTQTAELFAERYNEIMGYNISVSIGTKEDLKEGDFYLAYESKGAAAGVGEEGYVCNINDTCVICGIDKKGIYWGTITALQILKTSEGTMPQGMIRDYPRYPVRGFGIDVARKPVSLAMLYQIVENMSWYKMNDLSIHLNDNVILSTSGLTDSFEEAMTAYSAFRIDTSVINDSGEKLTSEDYAYTAEEFAQFIYDAKTYGVGVIPEIDTPAHSLSITRLFPEYALKVSNEAVDQIDLSKSKAKELVKDIWRETMAAAFDGAEIVNIGMDEYYGDGEAYRKYMNEIIELVHEEGSVETVRLWGSLGYMEGRTKPLAEGLQMNIWSDVWADPLEMYEDGYSLINMQNNHLYIIAGGGYDYLDKEELYLNWEPNKFYDNYNLEIVPAYSPKMLGAAYMIWNDMSGRLDVGISEVDLFNRFFDPLGVISGKLWSESENGNISYEEYEQLFDNIGCDPLSNPYAFKTWEGDLFRLIEDLDLESMGLEADSVEKGKMFSLQDESDEEKGKIIPFSGSSDYIETGYTGGNGNGFGIGGAYSISFDVYRQNIAAVQSANTTQDTNATQGIETSNKEAQKEQILFETDVAYAQTAFKAVQSETGKVGFSREGRDYSFDYTLPEEEWVTLTIRGEQNQIDLYVNGKFVDTLGDDEPFSEYATFVFPLERIGSRTNSFCGMIRNIEIRAE